MSLNTQYNPELELEKKSNLQIDIRSEKLAILIGDLFYNGLEEFLFTLGERLKTWSKNIEENESEIFEKISALIVSSSRSIKEAWRICKPFMNSKTNSKHTDAIAGFNITNKDLANSIGDLEFDILGEFLNDLSKKIKLDGEADKGRGRINLSHELFSCAEKLNKAYEEINKLCFKPESQVIKTNGRIKEIINQN